MIISAMIMTSLKDFLIQELNLDPSNVVDAEDDLLKRIGGAMLAEDDEKIKYHSASLSNLKKFLPSRAKGEMIVIREGLEGLTSPEEILYSAAEEYYKQNGFDTSYRTGEAGRYLDARKDGRIIELGIRVIRVGSDVTIAAIMATEEESEE